MHKIKLFWLGRSLFETLFQKRQDWEGDVGISIITLISTIYTGSYSEKDLVHVRPKKLYKHVSSYVRLCLRRHRFDPVSGIIIFELIDRCFSFSFIVRLIDFFCFFFISYFSAQIHALDLDMKIWRWAWMLRFVKI